MLSENFKYLENPANKPARLSATGWVIYILFGVYSTVIAWGIGGVWAGVACIAVLAILVARVIGVESKTLKLIAWTAYALFGIASSLTVALLGFWPFFAWAGLVVFGPALLRKLR